VDNEAQPLSTVIAIGIHIGNIGTLMLIIANMDTNGNDYVSDVALPGQ